MQEVRAGGKDGDGGVRPGGEPLITRRDLAVLHKVNPMTVTKWEQAGMPCAEVGRRGTPSLYSPSDVKAWLAARERNARTGDAVDLTAARARKEQADAELKEQALKARAGKLLEASEVEATMDQMVTAIRTRLLALPASAAERVARAATKGGADGVEAALDEAVGQVLKELAAWAPKPSN